MSNARPRPMSGRRGAERARWCGSMRCFVLRLQSIMLPAARAGGILVMQRERKRRAFASRVAAVPLAVGGLGILAAGLGLTQNDSRLQLLGDSLLAGIAGAIIWRGHESPLAAVGAWSICPAILVMGVLSAVGLNLERVVGGGGGHSPPY